MVELSARTSVNGADGVSVSLLRHGELMTVAASDETIMEMDTEQYATGEGPCVDASLRGRWFHAESLDIETRWPSFTPRAPGSRDQGHFVVAPHSPSSFRSAGQHLLADCLYLRCQGTGDGSDMRPTRLP